MWKYFFLGVLVGWLLHWLSDTCLRRRHPAAKEASVRLQPSPEVLQRRTAGAQAGMPPGDELADGSAVIEPNLGASTTAGTTAGRVAGDVAMGAPGAVSTSSATLTTNAPVYRQEDLEAIAGIGPKIGAMLRNNGITTFAELADTPVTELAQIVESTGEVADSSVGTWPTQARLAANQDWAALATFSLDLPVALQAQGRR